MRKHRRYGLLIIAAHWIVAVWHLFLAAKILPAPDNTVNWFAIGLLTLVHCGVAVSCWALSSRFAGAAVYAFFVVALGAGLYEHFLSSSLNNILRVAARDRIAAFRASVVLLVIFEILGFWFGIRFSQDGREPKPRVAC